MTQDMIQDDVFAAALDMYRDAATDAEVTAAENALIAGIKTARADQFRDATRAMTLIDPERDPRAPAIIDALTENAALLDDVRAYVHDKPERIGAKLRGGQLEHADSALSPNHLRILSFYVAHASEKTASLTP